MIDEKALDAACRAVSGIKVLDNFGYDAETRAALKCAILAYESAKPKEATDAMVAAGLAAALEFMRENGVDGLSPFADYPSPSECIRRVYRAMLSAAGDDHD